ncbi:MAG: hypothetical protein KC561_18295, partial [Myxococcales bacterium]|nr:hypothetical protein [Myxococcales bacterium]
RTGFWICGEFSPSSYEEVDFNEGAVFSGGDYQLYGLVPDVAIDRRSPMCENAGCVGGYAIR